MKLATIVASAMLSASPPTLYDSVKHCLDSTGRVDQKYLSSQYVLHSQQGAVLNKQFYCDKIDIVEQYPMSNRTMPTGAGTQYRPVVPYPKIIIFEGKDVYMNPSKGIDGDEVPIQNMKPLKKKVKTIEA